MSGETQPKVTIEHFTVNGASRVVIEPGAEVNLSWKVKDAGACVAFLPVEEKVDFQGTKGLKPDKTRVYVLRCTKEGASKAQAQVEVEVTDGLAIRSFSASTSSVKAGTPVMLRWEAQKAKNCELKAKTLTLEGPDYFRFFAAAMGITAIFFIFVAIWFKPETYVQEEEPAS